MNSKSENENGEEIPGDKNRAGMRMRMRMRKKT
jgi:hypothetical protein